MYFALLVFDQKILSPFVLIIKAQRFLENEQNATSFTGQKSASLQPVAVLVFHRVTTSLFILINLYNLYLYICTHSPIKIGLTVSD